jgi:hypothetical protein
LNSPISDYQRLVGDGPVHQGQPILRRQVLRPPRRQVVDRHHLVAPAQQQLRHMRADLTQTAGDERFHDLPLQRTPATQAGAVDRP